MTTKFGHLGISPACAGGDHTGCSGEFPCPGCQHLSREAAIAPCECDCHDPIALLRATPKVVADV